MITPPVSLPSRLLRLSGKQGAFSLVEVTLALGIVAFAFVSVLGLIPIGLNTFRNTMETSINSQIFQQVASDIQQTDFADLKQPQPLPLRYFDDQGTAKGNASEALTPAQMASVIYQVNTVPRIPDPALGEPLSNMATVLIEIVKNPANKPLTRSATGSILDDPAKGIYVARYFAFTASKGQ